MACGKSGNLAFLAVARCSDQTVVASYVGIPGENAQSFIDTTSNILGTGKIKPNGRLSLTGQSRTFHALSNAQNHLFVLIAANEYPSRIAFELLTALTAGLEESGIAAKVGAAGPNALSKPCKKLFAGFVTEYDDPGTKANVVRVAQLVDGVKDTLHDAIDTVVHNMETTEKIASQAEALQDDAKLFQKNAKTLQRRTCRQNAKMNVIIGMIVVTVLTVIVVTLYTSFKK